MPIAFTVLAIVMSFGCAAFLLGPVLRSAGDGVRPKSFLPIGYSVLILSGAFAFYMYNSQWNWLPNGVPDSPVAQKLFDLQHDVHERPNSSVAWRTLGLFYLQFEQLPPAIDSLNKSYQLTNGSDIETNLGLVEALSIRGAEQDPSRINELLALTLKIEPRHRKALWYGGEVAASQGKFELAIARWQVLLEESAALSTPEAQSVTKMISERIALAQERMNRPAAAEAITVVAQIAPKWHATLAPDTPVFILVRAKGQPGPPLAVHKTTSAALPLTVQLSDRDAMLPNRKISAFSELEIVARVALGGTPTAKSGDYFGSQVLGPNDPRQVSVIIDAIQP